MDMEIDYVDEQEEGEVAEEVRSPNAYDPVDYEIANGQPIPDTLHLRGLDSMREGDIYAFTSNYCPTLRPVRVVFIDDTSANLIFETGHDASQALEDLSDPQAAQITPSALKLRQARQHPDLPDAVIQLRQATDEDIRPAPRYSSEPYQNRRPDGRNNYRNQGYVDWDRSNKRRRDEDYTFDDNMYDDAPRAKPDLISDLRPGRAKRGRYGNNDLFASRLHREAGSHALDRARSASPISAWNNGDGRYGFDEPESLYTPAQASRSRNAWSANAGRELLPSNGARELFPGYDSRNGSVLTANRDEGPRELFPEYAAGNARRGHQRRESGTPSHRRTDAFDAFDDYSQDYSPVTKRRERETRQHKNGTGPALADRITNGPTGSLADRITFPEDDDTEPNQGHRIRGLAKEAKGMDLDRDRDRNRNKNAGKELFDRITPSGNVSGRLRDRG